FRVTFDEAFAEVMQACAAERAEGTWITPDVLHSYRELHRLGWAHSVEVWEGDELAGGLYGLAVGSLFAGESMFHRRTGASKVASARPVGRLGVRQGRFEEKREERWVIVLRGVSSGGDIDSVSLYGVGSIM